MVNCFKGSRFLTEYFFLGLTLILSQTVFAQDCLAPTVVNGNFVGDTNEGGTAAVLCKPGYVGGGPATCLGAIWTVLPGCDPKDCGTTTIANGVLLGDTFFGGNAVINCNAGYGGGGTAICGSGGTWTTLPGCNAIDCGDAGVSNGNNVGDTFYGGAPFVVCNTGYTGGGGGLTCLQSGEWDIQVQCKPKSCGAPTIANGVLNGDNFYTGTASVVCNAGYQGGGTATCLISGQWDILPTCTAKDCGTPTIPHGSLQAGSSTKYAGTATVVCDTGYTGGGTASCLDTGSWATLPTCNPVDCGSPTILHGVLTGSTVFAGSASVVCDTGYEGGGTATCLASGNWAALPPCNPVDCGSPTITFGKLAAGSTTVYGGTASAECNAGYTGGGPITCQSSGTWTANPTPCTPVDCGTPTVQHGQFFGDTFYSGSANVVCDTGYTGTGAAICSTTETWGTLPTCTARNCGTLVVPNGVFSGDTFYAGTAYVTCTNGYDGSGAAVCGSSGTWTTEPTCTAKDCGDPNVQHSSLVGNTQYDGGAFIQCDAGYLGGGAATCTAIGIWDPTTLPTCTPKDCGTPTIPNGFLSAGSETVYDGTATVECHTGYEGGGAAFCQTTAQWATLPTCDPVDCGDPNIPNGYLSLDSETVYAGTAVAECDSGYQLAGTNVATCLSDGTWDTLPICNPKDCGPLTDPVHGSVSAPITTYLSVATYTCQFLWQLNGSSTLTCEADGNWAPDPPTCDDIDCPALIVPTNGFISTPVVKVGTSVTVSCDTGYTLFGDEIIQCETGGTWNTTMGTCRKDCPMQTSPSNGSLSTFDVAEGTVVDVTCNVGYTLEGDHQLTCQPGGTWDYPLPSCTEDCQPLLVPEHGLIDTNVTSQGTVVTVSCDNGYTLFGADKLICFTLPMWSQPEPSCELDCPMLSPPQHGTIDSYALSKGTSVTYSCTMGYTLFGDKILTCQDNSTWDLTPPVCKKDCPTLTYPANGILSTMESKQGTITMASCFSGYTLFGAKNLTCQSDATWDYLMPVCRKDCPPLVPPTNGDIDSGGVSQETEVDVYCDSGYTLFGAPMLICQSDASWDNTMPSCKKDCPALNDPANGNINNTVIRSQETVVGVTCNSAYTLFGAAILTCQSNATWDFVTPLCKKDCPILIPPSNGVINTTIESQGIVVGVTCNSGYTLFGNNVMLCQTNANWDTEVPLCKKDCRTLIPPANGEINNLGVSQETVVEFSCDFGYTLFGSDTLLCQNNASWSDSEPTCEKDCPPLSIPHGSISTTEVIMDTTVNITCDTDYSLEGAPQLTCITNGQWNYATPACTKDCPALVSPLNGHLDSATVSQDSEVRVSCDTNYTLFGENLLTCQRNAQWDFPIPDCRIDCPALTIPYKAIFSTADKYEGVVVTVSCVTGFTRFGNQNITCLPGGFWDKSLPTCRQDCPALVTPAYGSLDTADVKEGTVVTVTCNTGYTLIGDIALECLPGGEWDKFLPVCDRECGPLLPPSNGLVSYTDGTTLNKKATYICNTGYDLSHAQSRVCRSDGSWSLTQPSCIIRNCGFIIIPPNGAIWYSNGVTTYLEEATFTCNPGYILTGEDTRLCLSDYTWSDISPICVIKDCGPLVNPSFGSVNTAGGTTFGEIATYYCNVGYTLIGNAQRRCSSDGLWDGTSPLCQINDCGNLTDPTNGYVSFSSTVYNKFAYYSCNPGYDRIGVSSRVCQKDAAWSASAPTCEIKDCGPLAAPTKGSVSYLNGVTTFESVAIFSCDAGYSIAGIGNRTCQANGKWGGASPTCQIKDCGTLSSPAHGIVNIVSGTTFEKTARYFCNFGYTLTGVSERLCQSDGIWSDDAPTCAINDCGNLTDPDNGAVSTSETTYNEIATYTCNTGYELVGVSQRVCRQDKTWSDSAPICQIQDCGSPFSIGHGSFITPIGTEYNASAIYNCDSNYGLVGDEAVLCLASGYWDIPPICMRDCGLPTELENGEYLLQTDTLSGAVATYSCHNGYELTGDESVTCRTTGAWDSPPYCKIISKALGDECYVTAQCNTSRSTCRSDGLGATRCLCADSGEIYNNIIDTCLADCGFQTAPTNGYIILPSEPFEGQIVTYSCDVGFALNNVAMTNRTCLSTGQWSGTAPLCVLGCPTPLPPTNGNFETPEGTAAGKFVYYSCDSGYSLVGDEFRECLTDTSWNGNTPSCLKECEILGSIKNGIVDLSSGHWENSIATYYCEKDYALVGTATRLCEGTGKWTGVAPECIYAIFPDVLLVIASLLIFLVIIDIFVVLVLIYMKYNKKKKDEPSNVNFDDIDDQSNQRHPPREVTPVENPDGVIPSLNLNFGPGRSSFRKPENVLVASETDKNIPQIPRKQKRSVLQRIPKPKPLKKLKRPKFFGSDTPMAPHPTPRLGGMDEFADEKIAEMERYLKDDFGSPSSSDANRRSTADEEKVSIDHVTSSRLMTGDKMVLMDFEGQGDELLTARLEEPPRTGREVARDRFNPRDRKNLITTEPPDALRPNTPIFPQQHQSEA